MADRTQLEKAVETLKLEGAMEVYFFGSQANESAGQDSNIDLTVRWAIRPRRPTRRAWGGRAATGRVKSTPTLIATGT